MKRFAIVLIVLALAATSRLYAYDWAAAKISVESEEADAGRTRLTLKDADGKLFVLGYDAEPSDAVIERILKIKSDFNAWKYIKIDRMSFEYSKDVLELNIVPSEFQYKGVNVLDYLPAGLLFSFYDKMFIRV